MKKALSTLLGSSLLAASLAVAGSAFTATSADAFSLSINPQYGTSNDNFNNSGFDGTGATAKLDFTFAQSGADVILNLGIQNTTNGTVAAGATQATLVGVGFDLASVISSYTYNSGSSTFTTLYNDAVLAPFGTFDIGIRSAGSGNFAGGNPTQGLTAGQSTSVSFNLKGTNLVAANLENAFKAGFTNGSLRAVGRFQQVSGINFSGASDKVLAGPPTSSNNDGPKKIPEPATTAALGFFAVSALGTRKRKAVAQA